MQSGDQGGATFLQQQVGELLLGMRLQAQHVGVVIKSRQPEGRTARIAFPGALGQAIIEPQATLALENPILLGELTSDIRTKRWPDPRGSGGYSRSPISWFALPGARNGRGDQLRKGATRLGEAGLQGHSDGASTGAAGRAMGELISRSPFRNGMVVLIDANLKVFRTRLAQQYHRESPFGGVPPESHVKSVDRALFP